VSSKGGEIKKEVGIGRPLFDKNGRKRGEDGDMTQN